MISQVGLAWKRADNKKGGGLDELMLSLEGGVVLRVCVRAQM